MKTIIIDTSHSLLAVGLVEDGKIIHSRQEVVQKKQSEYLLFYVDELMKEAQWKPKDLDRLVITDGPGSYTGMRIGITFAKTLALTHPTMEVFTVDTLLSLMGKTTGFAFIDARSKRVFGAYGDEGAIRDERVYQFEELRDITCDMFGDTSLFGEVNRYGNVIENILAVESSWVPVEDSDLLVPRYIK